MDQNGPNWPNGPNGPKGPNEPNGPNGPKFTKMACIGLSKKRAHSNRGQNARFLILISWGYHEDIMWISWGKKRWFNKMSHMARRKT